MEAESVACVAVRACVGVRGVPPHPAASACRACASRACTRLLPTPCCRTSARTTSVSSTRSPPPCRHGAVVQCAVRAAPQELTGAAAAASPALLGQSDCWAAAAVLTVFGASAATLTSLLCKHTTPQHQACQPVALARLPKQVLAACRE